jgi:protein-tyrosine-phosphatase
MKILFVCKYNAFRSRIAEEYFKKINQNKNIQVISRGIMTGGISNGMQRRISRELLGINIAKRKSRELNVRELIQMDLIIVVANDIPRIIFNYPLIKDKVIIWKIKDELKKKEENIKKIVLLVKKRVDTLNGELENGKKF